MGSVRVGNAMFMKPNSTAHDVYESRNIPRRNKPYQPNQSKGSENARFDRSKELHNVVLAKERDGDELMDRLMNKLKESEQRREQKREKSISKIREHNEKV